MSDLKDRLSKCTGCYYWRCMSGNSPGSIKGCHYMLDTGEPRGISPRDCYKHEGTPYSTEKYVPKKTKTLKIGRKKKERKTMANYGNYDIKTKEAAVKAVLLDKEAASEVCERFCVARSTLRRWVAEAKKEQQKYYDYADEAEKEKTAEQSRAEQSRAEQSSPSKTAMQKQTVSGEAEVGCEDMQQCETVDGLVESLYADIDSMKHIMCKFEKLQIVSDEEKRALERLYARAGGFILGLDYVR